MDGPSDGNPTRMWSYRRAECGDHILEPEGFYDGDGLYRVRLMPDRQGEWRFTTRSNVAELDGGTGTFTCVAPSAGNHGLVYVQDGRSFAYADGTPHWSVGTTCYAWIHQSEELQEQTLETLRSAPFNKMRMCVFPKHFPYNENEPALHPYDADADGKRDFSRPNPAFFRHLERRVLDLQRLGIEADIIIFHPYDWWGYATMSADENRRYVRYLVARLAAFRNVWWSMANEYDFMLKNIPMELWDELFQTVERCDPAGHLRSIHQALHDYDYTKPWVTHASIQKWDIHQTKAWIRGYGKPVVNDEPEYEGTSRTPSAYHLGGASWCTASGTSSPRRLRRSRRDLPASGGCPVVGQGRRPPRERSPHRAPAPHHGGRAGGRPDADGGRGFWERMAAGMNGAYRLIYFGAHQPRLCPMGCLRTFPTRST